MNKVITLVSGLTLLLQAMPAMAAPQQSAKTKTFAQWCQQKDSVPAATKLTIDLLLKQAGTENCNQANSTLSNLTRLDLNSEKISDLQPLSSLTKLINLRLYNNQIRDIEPLAGLNQLTMLYLDENKIDNLKALSKMNKLVLLQLNKKSPGVERSPTSGTFKQGDFTRLFQEVWNTVELIFQNGIDWASFSHAWRQIEIENQGVSLAIHSIEQKGEGTIVVKVEVPLDLDKAKLHQDFYLAYDLLLQSATDRHQIKLAGRDR
jgi:hypothetical protein